MSDVGGGAVVARCEAPQIFVIFSFLFSPSKTAGKLYSETIKLFRLC